MKRWWLSERVITCLQAPFRTPAHARRVHILTLRHSVVTVIGLIGESIVATPLMENIVKHLHAGDVIFE